MFRPSALPVFALVWLTAACGQPAPPYAAIEGEPTLAATGTRSAGAPAPRGGRTSAPLPPSPFAEPVFPPAPPPRQASPEPIDNRRTEESIGALEGRVDDLRFGTASDCRASGGTFTVTGCLPN